MASEPPLISIWMLRGGFAISVHSQGELFRGTFNRLARNRPQRVGFEMRQPIRNLRVRIISSLLLRRLCFQDLRNDQSGFSSFFGYRSSVFSP
jgi:hypothetical protein